MKVHSTSPSTAQLVYSGRAGGSKWNQPAMMVYSDEPSPGTTKYEPISNSTLYFLPFKDDG